MILISRKTVVIITKARKEIKIRTSNLFSHKDRIYIFQNNPFFPYKNFIFSIIQQKNGTGKMEEHPLANHRLCTAPKKARHNTSI